MLLPNNTKQLNENIAKNSEAINDIRADMSILNIENDKCKNDISEIKTELVKQKVSTTEDILKISDDISKTSTKVDSFESILLEVQSKVEKMQLEYETEKRNNENAP